MNENDDIILKYIYNKDVCLSQKGIYLNLIREGYEISDRTVRRKVKPLKKAGFLKTIDENDQWYEATEFTKRYIESDEDYSDLEKPE